MKLKTTSLPRQNAWFLQNMAFRLGAVLISPNPAAIRNYKLYREHPITRGNYSGRINRQIGVSPRRGAFLF